MMDHSISLTMLLVGAVCAPANLAHAQNEALYGAQIPEDAAFVRFVDHVGPKTSFGFEFADLEAASEAFTPVSAASLSGAAPGAFYTVSGSEEATLTIQEPARPDRRKVYVVLTNTSDAPVRLLVADGGPEVIAAVDSGASDARGVNPVSVTFEVDSLGNDALDTSFEVQLRRDQDVTFFVTDTGVRLIEDSLGPVAGN